MHLIKDCIKILMCGGNISPDQFLGAISIIKKGGATPAQIASFLTALHIKGTSTSDIISIINSLKRVLNYNKENIRLMNGIFISSRSINPIHILFSFYMRNLGYNVAINTEGRAWYVDTIVSSKESSEPLIKIENNSHKIELRELALIDLFRNSFILAPCCK